MMSVQSSRQSLADRALVPGNAAALRHVINLIPRHSEGSGSPNGTIVIDREFKHLCDSGRRAK